MEFETIKFDTPQEGIGLITLNQNLNAPSLEAAIELENRNQSILCLTPDFFQAVEAFGKRKK
jgi:hypothetical protein